MEYHVSWLLNWSCFEIFGDVKYGIFSSEKVDGKMILTKYGKAFVLNFSEMGNTVFSWDKKLMKRLYLLITRKFWFELFGDGEYGLFFESKRWWKDDIYLVFFSFPWYSRTFEIWFFVQWWILVLTNLLIILHTIFVLISSLALYTKHYDRKI